MMRPLFTAVHFRGRRVSHQEFPKLFFLEYHQPESGDGSSWQETIEGGIGFAVFAQPTAQFSPSRQRFSTPSLSIIGGQTLLPVDIGSAPFSTRERKQRLITVRQVSDLAFATALLRAIADSGSRAHRHSCAL